MTILVFSLMLLHALYHAKHRPQLVKSWKTLITCCALVGFVLVPHLD